MEKDIFVEVNAGSAALLEEIKGVYFSSFPEDERRPWNSMMSMLENRFPFFKMKAMVTAEGSLLGFYTEWTLPGSIYIEHFAVKSAVRGKGTGGKIIDHIVSSAGGRPVVVEVELPDTGEQAVRRIAFYERHGFEAMHDFPYFQPPYRPDLPEVPLMLMTTAPLEDPKGFVIMLHTLVYNQ